MFIGLDLGTSGLKGVLIDEDQKVLAEATAPLTVSRPQKGIASKPRPTGSPRRKRCWTGSGRAGAGRGEGHRAVGPHAWRDAAGRGRQGAAPLHPVERHPRPSRSGRAGRRPDVPALTGNIVFPGFTAPKLMWVARTNRQSCAQGGQGPAAQGLPAPLADRRSCRRDVGCRRHQLAGHRRRDWSDDLLAATGLTRGQMPRLVEGSEVSGICAPALAARWGLGKASSWRAAAATMRPRASASAWSARARPLSRLAPRASCLPRMTAISPTRQRRCTPSAMPCRHLAPDGRDPGRDRCAELVCRLVGCDAATLTGELGACRPPARRCSCPIWAASARR
jgi:xylulokinase